MRSDLLGLIAESVSKLLKQSKIMTETTTETERARTIVKSFYEGGARGEITSFKDRLAENFELFVPEYLPWGGHFNKQQYVDLLPQVATALDFSRMSYDSLTAEGGHVVAFIRIAVQGTDQFIMISEHWDIVGDKAVKLRVAYYDPKILLEQLGTTGR
jgi:ketosteroid isomerase-like protein